MFEVSRPRHFAAWPIGRTAMQRATNLLLLSLRALALLFCVPVASLMAQTPTPVTVPTWRYDLTHQGQNTKETALTPANVNVNTFGKLFSLPVDGYMYAQPLYVPGLKMSDGLLHNVLFVATENDSIYAFDADSNGGANANPIWRSACSLRRTERARARPQCRMGHRLGGHRLRRSASPAHRSSILPPIRCMWWARPRKMGCTSCGCTPSTSHRRGAGTQSVAIQATVDGTGNGSSGGKLAFGPLWQNQRSALDYYNGYVYFAFGCPRGQWAVAWMAVRLQRHDPGSRPR